MTTLVATIGSVVTTGADVAAVERIESADDPADGDVVLPADNGSSVPVGAAVDLTVQSAPAQRYGVLRGRVKSVGRTGSDGSADRLASWGTASWASSSRSRASPVPVLVRLDDLVAHQVRLPWSSSAGPPYAVGSMTLASGTVHLAEQRPIDWLLP